MKIGEKFEKIADAVYKKGVSDFGVSFDETGTNLVTIDKVHSKEHDAKVELTSKNLISPSVFADYELQEDGSYYAPKEKDRKKYSFELPAGTYTLSYKLKCSVGANYRLALIDKNGKQYQQYLVSTGDYVSFNLTFTASADIVSIEVDWGNESAIGCYIKELQIEKGSVATPYASYIDVSSDVESVTVCGKNLFDIGIDDLSTWMRNGIELTHNDDGSFNLIGTLRNINYIYVVPKTWKYTIPAGTVLIVSVYYEGGGNLIGPTLYDESNTLIRQFNSLESGGNLSHKLERDCKSIGYVVRFPNKAAGDYVEIRNIKLQCEIGSVATEWEAYQGGTYPVEDGKAIAKSVAPTMNITTPAIGVSIEAKGYLDGQAVIDELSQALVDIGGEI